MTGQVVVLRGDARHLPLRDECCDMVICSPPYYGLRSYGAGVGEIGSEPHWQDWLAALLDATREMARVLKPTGSIFVNLGDKYSGSGGNGNSGLLTPKYKGNIEAAPPAGGKRYGMSPKSLLLLPERYRVACVDQLGLIARAVIVWHKKNHLPESAGDRVHRAHEDWVHLVKSPRYYSAIDELREPWTGKTDSDPRSNGAATAGPGQAVWSAERATGNSGGTARPSALTELPTNCSWDPSRQACRSTTCAATACASGPSTSSSLPCVRTCSAVTRMPRPTQQRLIALPDTPTTNETPTGHPTAAACARNACARRTAADIGDSRTLGRWPSSVWSIASEPLRLPPWIGTQHYAAFPSEWPRRLILGFSPPGVCVECGQGRWPVVEPRRLSEEAERLLTSRSSNNRYSDGARRGGDAKLRREELLSGTERQRLSEPATILGYACACTPHTTHPGTGEPSGPDKRYGDHLDGGNGYPNVGAGFEASPSGKGGLGDRPRVGPWREYHLNGWQPPPARPAVILDPFGGTGTTAHVAAALGRIGVSIDLSHAYSLVAKDRTLARQRADKVTGRRNLELQGTLWDGSTTGADQAADLEELVDWAGSERPGADGTARGMAHHLQGGVDDE